MTKQTALQTAFKILKQVFHTVDEATLKNLTLKKIEEEFSFDIPKAEEKICALTGEITYAFFSKEERVASQKAIAEEFKKTGWMREKRPLKSIEDILKAWEEIKIYTAEKNINSKDFAKSDSIYNSRNVYKSVSIFDSRDIIFCYKIFNSAFMLASRDSSNCSFGIRVNESINCSNCFEVSWSNKVSNSLFIHDSYDLYESMFCSHLKSKRYCIANMQFEKEEYFGLKRRMEEWIFG